MHKCTTAQMHKRTNAQMLKCSNAQTHKCTIAQIQKRTNAQMHKRQCQNCTQHILQQLSMLQPWDSRGAFGCVLDVAVVAHHSKDHWSHHWFAHSFLGTAREALTSVGCRQHTILVLFCDNNNNKKNRMALAMALILAILRLSAEGLFS